MMQLRPSTYLHELAARRSGHRVRAVQEINRECSELSIPQALQCCSLHSSHKGALALPHCFCFALPASDALPGAAGFWSPGFWPALEAALEAALAAALELLWLALEAAADARSAWLPAKRCLRLVSSSFGMIRNSTYIAYVQDQNLCPFLVWQIV